MVHIKFLPAECRWRFFLSLKYSGTSKHKDSRCISNTLWNKRKFPGMRVGSLSLETGATGFPINPWNGTGGLAPEGPHIYKKDGYYYLTIV
jgi:hypothetical protein